MKKAFGFSITFIILSAAGPFASPGYGSDEAAKRLIQTSPTERRWMTENELAEHIRSVRAQGKLGGFMDVTNFQDKVMPAFPVLEFPSDRPLTQGSLVARTMPELSAKNIMAIINKLSSFRTRYYDSASGLTAATWIHDQFVTLARNRTDVTVEFFPHAIKQPSVVARIAGKGPKASEVVVIGGHEDSIVSMLGIPLIDSPAPGADDNASGVATVLEIFRVLVETSYKPQRTIEFITYAGEEGGLLGSQEIAQKYLKENRKVMAVLQLDMTMYPGKEKNMIFITDYVSRPLTKFLEALTDQYVKAPWKESSCGYACSDHGSWDEAGYPAAFPFEAFEGEMNPKIHTENDTAEKLDAAFGMNFAKLALSFALELGSGE